MPHILGYLRPDTNGRNAQSQLDLLKASGATRIYRELPAGAKRDRPQLARLMTEIRAGDTVVVTSLDRIARNTRHLLEIVESLNSAGVTFRAIDQGIDTSTPHGAAIRTLLGAITDFERQVVRESQARGIARAKREGRYKGRKPTARAKTDEVLALNAQGLTRQKIADQLGIGVASVYRILRNHAASRKKPATPQEKTVGKPRRAERKPPRKSDPEQLSFF
jgi:DNA invertase Pin-like site-specific DNA recombinase